MSRLLLYGQQLKRYVHIYIYIGPFATHRPGRYNNDVTNAGRLEMICTVGRATWCANSRAAGQSRQSCQNVALPCHTSRGHDKLLTWRSRAESCRAVEQSRQSLVPRGHETENGLARENLNGGMSSISSSESLPWQWGVQRPGPTP